MTKLTKNNLRVLNYLKEFKRGLTKTELSEICDLSFGGINHHVNRLLKSRKVKIDKKTHTLTAVK